jgi:hypothetical protein
MDFYIEGKIRNEAIVRMYMESLVKALELNRLRKPHIEVEFVNKLGAFGLCSGDRDEVKISIAKKCPATGRRLTFLEMMQTLAHEMVHARQFLRGQLSAEGAWKWKGRNADGYDYENQPWEKEAYRLEKTLFGEQFPFYLPFKN